MADTNLSFWSYVKAAFFARPKGFFVAPNLILLGIFAFLGILNWGFLAVGAGVELAYLLALASSGRFQKYVQGSKLLSAAKGSQQLVNDLIAKLPNSEQAQYRALAARCEAIVTQQNEQNVGRSIVSSQGEGLGKLLWIYLRLLVMRQTIRQLIQTPGLPGEDISEKAARLKFQLKNEKLAPHLKNSIQGQIEILEQRLAKRGEAKERIAFVDSELARIEQQIELIREQAIVSASSGGAASVSERIDQIGTTLNSTNEWMQQQSDLLSEVEDLTQSPPLVVTPK